jgi:hypothetical protein
MSASLVRRLIAAGLAALAIGAVLVAPATAKPLDLGRAEKVARAVVAPETVERAVCLHVGPAKRGAGPRRALCLLAHPAPPGHLTRSLVSVRRTGDGLRAKRIRRVTLPLPDLTP